MGDHVHEASWVRSIYLYLMCVVSIALIGFGAVASVTGFVHTVAPDLGHRDTLDRVGIGLANIATEVIGLVDEGQGGGEAEEFCQDATDNDEDLQDCLDSQGGGGTDSISAIQDGIDEVKSELRGQIRNSAIDLLIRGVLLIAAGVVLFRIHGHRTELFADGVMPKKSAPTSTPDSAPPAAAPYVAPVAPVAPAAPEAPLPPPPGAPG